jgi:hypothetical protein
VAVPTGGYEGKSISDLGDDLRQMEQSAYPELDLRAQEVLAINQLYKTVTLVVKCRCMDKECHTTLSEVADVIERYESIMGSGEKRSTVRAIAGQPDQSQNVAAEIEQVKTTLQQVIQRLERLEVNNNRHRGRSRSCYQCGAENHFIRDCPRNRQ